MGCTPCRRIQDNMPIKKTDGVEFRIDVVGEETGEQYKGKFAALPRLSARLKLVRDQRRRELLGSQPGEPSAEALVYANVMANLHVHLVEWPKWWPEMGFGLELEDEAPLIEIGKHIDEITKAHKKQIEEAGKAAEKEIREKVTAAKAVGDEEDDPE
jgi:hypothetical protein